MLSIIICSISHKFFNSLEENIKTSIGDIKHELIKIDNTRHNYSIAKAYNIGIKKAKFPHLLFLHEDILFHTKNWGPVLLDCFKEPEIGVIGVAGSKVKSKIPSPWWEYPSDLLVKNIIQHRPNDTIERLHFGFSEDIEETVIIDGVFIAVRKDERLRFNERIPGFHSYDQCISLEARKIGYKVMVVRKILIEHFSNGKLDAQWVKSSDQLHDLYNKDLPQAISKSKLRNVSLKDKIKRYMNLCKMVGNKAIAFKYWLKYIKINPLDKQNISWLKYFLK